MAKCLMRRRAQRSSNAESKNNPSKALERLELWSLLATLLIFVGITASFVDVIAIRFPGESWRQVAWEEIGNVLEGIGLVIEAIVIPWAIIHTRREKAESDKEVSEANKLAAEANERAALLESDNLKLKQHLAPRRLGIINSHILADELRGKIEPLYIHSFGGSEPSLLASDLAAALSSIGLVERNETVFGVAMSQYLEWKTGVSVYVPPEIVEDEAALAQDALIVALRKARVRVDQFWTGIWPPPPTTLPEWKPGRRIIVIGEKSFMQL